MPFKPPENFDFKQPESWPQWRKRFERFMTANELSAKSFQIQLSSLIYAMGTSAEQVYESFHYDETEGNLKAVLDLFDKHFVPQKNIIHVRAMFYQRSQDSSESIEEFYRALYELSEHGNFPNREDTIRDRFVLGVSDRELSEKLQLQADLTLENAVKQARQYESVKKQLGEQRKLGEKVDAVHAKGRATFHAKGNVKPRGGTEKGGNPRFNKKRDSTGPRDRTDRCGRCGRGPHSRDDCPAIGQRCRTCQKFNHFSSVCRMKQLKSVDAANETYFLGTVQSPSNQAWMTDISIGQTKVKFKIDTGADVTVMPAKVYKTLKPQPTLMPSKVILQGAGGQIDCLGRFKQSVTMNSKTVDLEIYVAEGQTDCLLSREASVRCRLVKRIGNIERACGPVSDPVKCLPVKITLKENNIPYSLNCARRVPIPLLEKVKHELQRMEEAGVIEEITEPTDWCAPMVPVLKKNGSVRICADLKKLNLAVKRERYPIPTLEDLLHKLKGAKVFSKLDATSGFYQIPLDEASSKLTTFITPHGRYMFRRLPFGISSAPEIFQRTMENILQDEKNVVCFYDDILVFGESQETHDRALESVIDKITKARLKLNKEKCVTGKPEMEFLGHIVSGDGIKPDPKKVKAIAEMPEPTNVAELRRMLGMFNFLGRYLSNLSSVLKPVTELLEKDATWQWGEQQRRALTKAKELLTTAPTLAHFDLSRPTIVSADASSYGMGGVLLQDHEGQLKPIAFCSRTLTSAERGYAQVEKECLAAIWTCEKFSRYLIGLPTFTLQTDHKPLVPLINTKDLHETPPRCQRMLIRFLRFNLKAVHTPGKDLVVADALSRSPVEEETEEGLSSEDVEAHVDGLASSWPISDKRLDEIAQESQKDQILREALQQTASGWPKYRQDLRPELHKFYEHRGEFSVYKGLLLRGTRITIPTTMQKEILEKIHHGHQGVAKCRERAKLSVWWPGISQEIKNIVKNCRTCEERRPSQPAEPLVMTELPERPFQKVSCDLFEFKAQHYLVLYDFHSRFIEIAHLGKQTSEAVINSMKNILSRHGIPELIITDNGRQFTSKEFQDFADSWQFSHRTTSPYHSQANGGAERAVKEAKKILSQDDPALALLIHRSTPTSPTGESPAMLAYGRNLRTTLPCLPATLEPRTVNKEVIKDRDTRSKISSKLHYDRCHGAKELPELLPGDVVLQKLDHEKQWGNPATVVKQCAPRSYEIQSPKGLYRRNRRHLMRTSRPLPQSVQVRVPNVPMIQPPVPNTDPILPLPSQPTPRKQKQLKLKQPVQGYQSIQRNAEASHGHHSSGVSTTSQPDEPSQMSEGQPTTTPPAATTRSGRIIKKPSRYR